MQDTQNNTNNADSNVGCGLIWFVIGIGIFIGVAFNWGSTLSYVMIGVAVFFIILGLIQMSKGGDTPETVVTLPSKEPVPEEKPTEPDMSAPTLDLPYFTLCREIVDDLDRFQTAVNDDPTLLAGIKGVGGCEVFDRNDIFGARLNSRITIFISIDLVRLYRRLGHDFDPNQKEFLPIYLYLAALVNPTVPMDFVNCNLAYGTTAHIVRELTQFLENIGIEEMDGDYDFLMGNVLRVLDEDRYKEYQILLYRIASLIAKADGVIDEKESNYLAGLLIPRRPEELGGVTCSTAEKTSESSDEQKSEAKPEPPKRPAMEQLQELIGLETVKEEVTRLSNFIKIQRQRSAAGLKQTPISYHCVFTGNPGTGKTTVARILADIYREMGILEKGQLVETDRSGLVGEYVGQTAVKTNKIIDSALDGVLFIDEAYSLVQGSQNDFGGEAIATLLKRMEDDRKRLVVILAGYNDEMKDFIDSNPGLQSRFNRYIHFDDYDTEALMQIFRMNISRHDYVLTPEADARAREVIDDAVRHKDKNFGNARYVRNLFEKTLENQAGRLAAVSTLDRQALQTILPQDLPDSQS